MRLGGALLACAVFQALLLLAPGHRPVVLVGGLLTTMLAAGAAIRHVVLARRNDGRARAAWAFTAASTAMWALGSALYTVDVSAGHIGPPPRPADWFCFLAVALTPGVLIAGPSAPVDRGIRLRLVLDGLMVAAALFVPAWPLLLRPVHEYIGSTGGLLAAVIPALHIVSLSIAIVLLSRSRGHAANAITVLAGAFAGFAITVLLYLYLGLHGGSWQVHSLTGLFAAVTVLLGFAGQFPMPVSERPWQEAPTGLRMALPYLPVAVALVMGGVLLRQDRTDGVIGGALLLVGVLVLVRQFLALRSNARLLAEVEEHRELLAHQATHDDLTGLANRKLLHSSVAEAVAGRHPVALLIIDLDGFKQVNDRYGHGAGDDVLVRTAAMLCAATPEGMLAARLGGDEFAILLCPAAGADQAMAVAADVIARVAELGEGVGASVGVVHEPDGRATLGSLLSDADAALYRAKAAGKGVAVGA